MPARPRALWLWSCLLLSLAATGCGAGLITGIVASDRGGGAAAAPPPELSVATLLPLVSAPNTVRSVVVANAQIATTARLRVRLLANGVGVDQLQPTATGQGGSTSISFVLATAPILATVADPTLADVAGTLQVFVDDREVASAVPITLARQPRAFLELPAGEQQRFVSPLGERIALRVEGLRSNTADALQVIVATRDPASASAATRLVRLGAGIRVESTDALATVVSVAVPGNPLPGLVELTVRDAVAGLSTTITNAYYRPDISVALPSEGPTTGGTPVSLIGTALAPLGDASGPQPAPWDFSGVRILFVKGGRITVLDADDLRRDESNASLLSFNVPASPDGRPGQVDVVLEVDMGGVTGRDTASQVFLFANPDPFFGPRGIVLDQAPIAIAAIKLDDAPSESQAPDMATLTRQGGVGFLQLLLAEQNGMFQPFGAPRRIGDPEVAAERGPSDLCVGDFDGDQVPDLFLANSGAAVATHHLVLGQRRPAAPLGSVHKFDTVGGIAHCRAARLDGDAVPDLVLLPSPALVGARPLVLLARPAGPGAPGFTAPMEVAVRPFPIEAAEVADLDGDGNLDLAVVSGAMGKLDIAYGNGDGTFGPIVALDFTVPGYAFSSESPAVGLHACRDGTPQSLGLVLAGIASPPPPLPPSLTPPMVAVLRATVLAPRSYQPPTAVDTYAVPTEPIGRSLVDDIDVSPPVEMVIAMRGNPGFVSLGVLQLQSGAGFLPIFATIEGAILTGAESPTEIQAILFDRAFPATTPSGEAKAVYLVHATEVDGAPERRLSTRLITTPAPGEPQLLPPDDGERIDVPISCLVGGDFHRISIAGEGSVLDLALALAVGGGAANRIRLVANDGFGGFPSLSDFIDVPGLVPNSLTVTQASGEASDGLVFADQDSRLGFWRHDLPPPGVPAPAPARQLVDAWSPPLRAVLAPPLLTTALGPTTTQRLGDVDGDGFVDLVVLLSFALPSPGEGQAALALLRGKATASEQEFPFHVPTHLTPVHGNASSITLGDFVPNGPSVPRRLELAVAVPDGTAGGPDGDHVRFFRYAAGATPADDRFVQAATTTGPQVLLAGSSPTQVVAADLDRNGTVDLMVAGRGDALRLFRNSAAPDVDAVALDIGAFGESSTGPWQLASGVPTRLRLGDVNGDGNLDVLVFVESVAPGTGASSTRVGIYLSTGAGTFDGPRYVAGSRVGDRDGTLSGDLGDWNRDGLPDLLLGWDSLLPTTNLRVLFGGTR
jgi:hypothetical protein